jgi:hypothetical protein
MVTELGTMELQLDRKRYTASHSDRIIWQASTKSTGYTTERRWRSGRGRVDGQREQQRNGDQG